MAESRSAGLRPGWILVAILIALLLWMALLRTREELLPELVGAHVALQPHGTEVATVGRVFLEVGSRFQLHAVVEAEDWRGRRVFYTDAEALELGGGRVPADSLRRWERSEDLRILWFTVEGVPPYLEVENLEDLRKTGFREVFQGDWPQSWSVPGRIAPALENYLPGRERSASVDRFGVQRFHVRIELFEQGSTILPIRRLRSAGAAEVEVQNESFPTVTVTLVGALQPLSRAFGLPQIEATKAATPGVRRAVLERAEKGLCFSRLPLVRAWLTHVGTSWDALEWRPVELTGEAAWGQAGDVLRAGSKIAFTYRDQGRIGRLDDQDLCLDFDRGATVRTLGEIFVGEGLVERARTVDAAVSGP